VATRTRQRIWLRRAAYVAGAAGAVLGSLGLFIPHVHGIDAITRIGFAGGAD
jgi:hypothetical protein